MHITARDVYPRRVAAEVRAAMARQRITTVVLAARIGTTPSTLRRRLRGDDAFDVTELARIAIALAVDIHTLIPPIDGTVAA